MAVREEEVDVAGLNDKPVAEYDEVDDDSFEIMSEDDERAPSFMSDPDPVKTEAEVEMEAMRAQLAALQEKADAGKQVASGFDNLGAMFEKMNKPKPDAPKQIDWDAEQKRLKDLYYEDPVKAQIELNNLTYGPALQQMQQKLDAAERRLARNDVLSSDRNKTIYDSYKSEVEDVVQSFSNDPDAYRKALSIVGMNHFDEMLEKEISKREPSTPTAPKKPGFNSYNETPTPAVRKPRGIVLKTHEKNEFDRAFSSSPFSDQKYFYENVWLPRRQK